VKAPKNPQINEDFHRCSVGFDGGGCCSVSMESHKMHW